MIYVKSIEISSIADIVKNKLHTMSDSGLLETGGMLKVDFFEDSLFQQNIKPLKNIEVEFFFKDSLMSIFSLKNKEKHNLWHEEIIERGYLTQDSLLFDYSISKNYNILSPEILNSWINLDKYFFSREKKDLIINLNNFSLDTEYYLFFKNINTVCIGGLKKNKVVFKDIPLGLKAFILSLKNISESSINYSLTEVSTSDDVVNLLPLIKSNPKELNILLNKTFGESFKSNRTENKKED